MSTSSGKIPLTDFLKILTSNGSDMKRAMAIAGKVYKHYNTPESLLEVTDAKLKDVGLSSEEDRKFFISSLVKTGYTRKPAQPSAKKVVLVPDTVESHSPKDKRSVASSSNEHGRSKPITTSAKPTKRKRKQGATADENEFLPSAPLEREETEDDLDFKEVLDEDELKLKSVIINRAPIMMAWSSLVAEKMNFSRAEALSIASVYTEMNAVSKGVTLGKYTESDSRGREAAKDGSQPYVELLGRRVPLYRTKNDQWRALSNGQPVAPKSAFDYISRSFKQMTPFVIGALKLLVDSYSLAELTQKAWSLYAEFRPEVNEWGKRSEMHLNTILGLRKKALPSPATASSNHVYHVESAPRVTEQSTSKTKEEPEDTEPSPKRARKMTVEEYEALLDNDTTFDYVDLDVH